MKTRIYILVLGLLITPRLFAEGLPPLPVEELSWGKHCPDGSVCLPNKVELESVIKELRESKALFPESHGSIAAQEFTPYFAAIAEDAQIAEDFATAHALIREFAHLPSSVDTFLVFSALLHSPKRDSLGGPTLTFEQFILVHKKNRVDGLMALDFMAQAIPDLEKPPLGLSQDDALQVINRMLQTKDPFQSYSSYKRALLDDPPVHNWSELKKLLKDMQLDLRIDDPIDPPLRPELVQKRIDATLRKEIVSSKDVELSEAEIQKELYAKQRERRKSEADKQVKIFSEMDAQKKRTAQIGESFETGFNPEIPTGTLDSLSDLFPSEEHRIAYLLKIQILSDPTLYAHTVKEMEGLYEPEAHSIAAMSDPLKDVLEDWERISYARNPVTGLGLPPAEARLFKDELARHMASDPEVLERHRDAFFGHLETPLNGPEKEHVKESLFTADRTLPGVTEPLFPGGTMSGSLFNASGPYEWVPLAPKITPQEIELTKGAHEDPKPTEVATQESKVLPYVLLGGAVATGVYLALTKKPKTCVGNLKRLSKPSKEDYSRLLAKSSMPDPQGRARELLKDFENMDYKDTPWMTRAWKKIDRYFSELEDHGVQVERPVVPFHLRSTRVHLAQQRGNSSLPTLVVPTAKGKEYKLWDVEIAAREKTGPLSSVLTDRVRQAQLESAFETLKLISEIE